MPKKYLLSIAFSLTIITTLFAQQDRKERIIASYMIAFGQVPQQGEINYWMSDPLSNRSLSELVEKHQQNMKTNKQLKYNAINNSYLNAFGRTPEPSEVKYWEGGNEIYAELYTKHVQFLKNYAEEWKKAIITSYLREWNRSPKKEEVEYWINQTVVRSYVDIVYNHKLNKQKDPTWNKTTQSQVVSQLKFSGNTAQEAQKLLNTSMNAASVISTGGLNVISTGGLNVISTGGLNVISTGGLN